MDNLRNIISNLEIYQGENYSNRLPLFTNKYGDSKENQYYYNNISNIYKNTDLEHSYNQKLNISHYKYCDYCKDKDNQNLNENENESPIKVSSNYYTIKDDYFKRKNINFIKRNIDFVREQEYKMREEKLRQENEALKLLLLNSHSKKNFNINPRLYDYEKNQRVKFKLKGQRAQSSNIILEKREGDYSLEKDGTLKYFGNLYNSVKLPEININNNTEIVPVKDSFSYLNLDKNKKLRKLKNNKSVNFSNSNNNSLNNIKEENYKEEDEKKNDKEIEIENNLPRNMRVLSEDEKNERIKELTYLKKELEDELFEFPIARLSLRQKERKAHIEKCLYDIDEELNRLTSLKVVVVKI